MNANLLNPDTLRANPDWASLPLFDRTEWKRVPFGEVVQNVNETEREPLENGIERFIGLEHLEPGSLHVRRWGNVADGTTFTRRCRAGQVLFGKRRAYQRKVAVAEFDAVVSGDIYVFAPKNGELIPELLPFLCMSDRFFEHAVGTSAGSLSPRTNWSSLANFEFDLPPIDKQRRIAEILWAVDETAVQWADAAQLAEIAKNTRLTELFERELNNEQLVPLSEVSFLQTGVAKGKRFGKDEKTVELPYLRVANVQDGSLDLSEIKIIQIEEHLRNRYLLRDKDVVICEGGDIDKVGRGSIWRSQIEECLHQNHIFCIRANEAIVIPEFLEIELGSPYGKRFFLGCAKKTSNLASINATQTKAFPFILPSFQKQQVIVQEVQDFRRCIEATLKSSKDTCNVLRLLLNNIFR